MSSGINFLEMIENIKKITKNLKQTNYGKKIYDNLMANYGEYLSVNKVKGAKKPSTITIKKPNILILKKEKTASTSNNSVMRGK